MKGELNMSKNYMDYKSECLNRFERSIDETFHEIDNALQTCLDDYYEACETSNMLGDMLGDTLKLFAAVQHFSVAIRHDNDRDDAWMVRELISEGMSGREGCDDTSCMQCTRKCKTPDDYWNDYVGVLKENMKYELERVCYAQKRFCEDGKLFSNLFGNM